MKWSGPDWTVGYVCVCVEVFVWPVAVDITMMIIDQESMPQLLVHDTLSTVDYKL